MSYENVEDAFKDLDKREFHFFASALASYRKALMDQGFTRREAVKLAESYSKFIYEMSIEEYMNRKAAESSEVDIDVDDDDDDVVK